MPVGRLSLFVAVPLGLQAAIHLADLRHDRQELQAQTIRAVHAIFPEPVPYIDHSGMIASFPKANFFMSTWGMESYRASGRSFMQAAIDAERPMFVISNAPVLMPSSPEFQSLFHEDRRYIEKSYVPYWGAIRVAGAEAEFGSASEARLALPFHGRYRVESDFAVTIDGMQYVNGSILEIGPQDSLDIVIRRSSPAAASVRLVWAQARHAPPGSPPSVLPLYSRL